ncbi:MAG TPA: GMC family oxidoreductase N-terminal domain-containing protein [Pyrinomonadaceae bacterium]|nr:GMC family oxidoreductase N-terminal domain-containing protein [Pyrinomonadaceae bacterium]
MARIASPIDQLKEHYTVVVIGSGYGGGITASRMARAVAPDNQKITVCVLERGKEFLPGELDKNDNLIKPGEYPDTEFEAMREVQVDLPQFHTGSRTGLFDLRMNKEINVFVGCGLGGTSLVNANVCIKAEDAVFASHEWPAEIRSEQGLRELREGYELAQRMLRPAEYPYKTDPINFPPIAKLTALEKSASRMGAEFYLTPINVNFEKLPEDMNHVGVEQHRCKGCGDCMTGCNYRAKNTVLMNYLPDARNNGADIFTEVSVRYIERKDDRWLVHYQLLQTGQEKFDAPTMFVSADVVILSAGTLGSSEILLRSKQNGLSMSSRVGENFSGNGDVLAFGYNCDEMINGVGFGHRTPDGRDKVGPCITGIIDMRKQPQLSESVVVEEGSIAGAFAAFLPKLFAAAATLLGKDTDEGVEDRARELRRELESLTFGPFRGAVRNTQTMLAMSHDNANGRLYLDDDRLRISWPDVRTQPNFARVDEKIEEATRALGGTYLKNPLSNQLMGQDLITVHPLGGCIMASSAETGAVNHMGQVFSGPQGTKVYNSLYVSDGSVIPRALGINPLLTISALAERCCALMAKERGWDIKYHAKPKPAPQSAPAKVGIRFSESMKGYFSTKFTDNSDKAYEQGAKIGRQDGSPFQFVLTIVSDDLERTISDSNYYSRIIGTVTAPALSANPLTVSRGEFNYFLEDVKATHTPGLIRRLLGLLGLASKTVTSEKKNKRMQYKMLLTGKEGQKYYFHGIKIIRNDPGPDCWSDATTLYITLYQGENMDGTVMGKGILSIPLASFVRQMTTMQVTNANGLAEKWDAMLRFGRFFGGQLIDTYGANLV